MPSATSLDETDAATRNFERILRALPRGDQRLLGRRRVERRLRRRHQPDQSQITALLVPPHERHRSSAAIGGRAPRGRSSRRRPRRKVQIGRPNAFGFGGFGGQPIQALVQGNDAQTVDQLATQVQQAMRDGARRGRRPQQQRERPAPDPGHASTGAAPPTSASRSRAPASRVRTAIDGWRSNENQFRQPGQTSIDIRIINASAGVSSAESIAALPVLGHNGQVVQLGQFATIKQVETPTSIRHVNRLRSVTIGAEPGEGKLVGDVQAAVEKAVAPVPMPAGYAVTYAGQGGDGGDAFTEIFMALGMALILMYMLMVMLFGSLVLPLAVLMSLPLAVVGRVRRDGADRDAVHAVLAARVRGAGRAGRQERDPAGRLHRDPARARLRADGGAAERPARPACARSS